MEHTPPPPSADENKFVLSISGGPAQMQLSYDMPLSSDDWEEITGILGGVKRRVVKASKPEGESSPQEDLSGSSGE